MTTPTTGPIKLSNLQTEFGGNNPISFSEYYRGGAYVPGVGLGTSSIPVGGLISLGNLRGKYKFITVTYDIIGGGGGGGWGIHDGGGSGSAPAGGASSFSGVGFAGVSAAGGAGGANGVFSYNTPHDGVSSAFGSGGAGGGARQPGFSANGYGAGGGGGGGDAGGTYDSAGNAGQGGFAGQRITGSIVLAYGTLFTAVVGGYGAGSAGEWSGGNGSPGRIAITWDGKTTVFLSTATSYIGV